MDDNEKTTVLLQAPPRQMKYSGLFHRRKPKARRGPRFNFDPPPPKKEQLLTVDTAKAWAALGRTKMLSERELQVMSMLVIGMTVSETARALFLSVKTTSTYRCRIHQKLGTKQNDANLIRMAIAYKFLYDANEEK